MKKILYCMIVFVLLFVSGCGGGKTSEKSGITLSYDNRGGFVYSYVDQVYEYLLSGLDANVHDYMPYSGRDQYKPIVITVNVDGYIPSKYNFSYGLKDDYSDAKTMSIESTGKTADFTMHNLFKSSIYYIKVEVIDSKGNTHVEKSTLKTTSLGPRIVHVPSLDNVRDIGGYQTASGKVVQQGLLYRGVEMNGIYGYNITEEGRAVMHDELGIRFDMDLRDPNGSQYILNSPIGNDVGFKNYSMLSYASIFDDKYDYVYARIIKDLAVPEHYPVYFHCMAGADRTGTLAFLIENLLGMDELDIKHDFEITSFSRIGERNCRGNEYKSLVEALNEKYDGATTQAKVEQYMLDIGVTAEEIETIKGIMFGEISIV